MWGWCSHCMARVGVVVGSNHCGIGVAQGFPIGRLEHQSRGRTSLGVSVVEAAKQTKNLVS